MLSIDDHYFNVFDQKRKYHLHIDTDPFKVFKVKGFALDKDILQRGNKLYCENNCVFIPQQLNNLVIRETKLRC